MAVCYLKWNAKPDLARSHAKNNNIYGLNDFGSFSWTTTISIVMYLYHLYIPYLYKVLHYQCTDHPLGVPPFGWTDLCHLTFLYCVHQPPTLACPLCTPSCKIYKKMQRSTISTYFYLQQSVMPCCYILQLLCSWLLTRQFCNFLPVFSMRQHTILIVMSPPDSFSICVP